MFSVVSVLATIVYFGLLAFLVLMWVRIVFDWVRVLRRGWRPRGVALVVAELSFTVTDPSVRIVRRLVKPIRFGEAALDFSSSIVLLLCLVLMYVVGSVR
ncbi:YggT family protein [soil metagenome]